MADDQEYQDFLAFKAAQKTPEEAAKPKRRTIAEVVHALVHSGNHVDLMDDADALVTPEKDADADAEKDTEKEDTPDAEES
jgi:hypothetical protein